MSGIRILPDLLANKIAAGEVVERPASVVKELVENALDAGGSRILIEIENGGRSMIQVADNGSGMGKDDALLSLERFATSKLFDETGLTSIATLGFRGEALPSIAAVSKLTLITRRHLDPAGCQVTVQGGRIQAVQEIGAPTGTLIKVSQLFYNTPARRKFLKSVSTEMSHIADVVSGMALCRPQVHFSLSHNNKNVFQWAAADAPVQRTAQVLGQASAPDFIALDSKQEGIELRGFLGPPHLSRTTSRGCYVFVNGRRVHDRVVQHALLEGYRGRLVKGRFPMAVIDLRLPFDQVDVNVHPTKHEVRFADAHAVHMLVQSTVASVLDRFERRLWAAAPATRSDANPLITVSESASAYPSSRIPGIGFEKLWQKSDAAADKALATRQDIQTVGNSGYTTRFATQTEPVPRFSDLQVIGQFKGMYIICQASDDLILIDQHAAHERIVYEALLSSAAALPSQLLLLPATVQLGFAEAQALEKMLPELAAMGMEIEHFGGNTFAVRAVPGVLETDNIEPLIVELAEKRVELGPNPGLERIMEQSRMVIACHKAIRANQRLTTVEINTLLKKLDLCRDPSHCPHGRPTWIRWTKNALAKAFGRS